MTPLKKGANAALTRENPSLSQLVVGVSWRTGAERSLEDHLTVATILCGADGRALSGDHFVFFNQLTTPDLSVTQLQAVLGPDKEQIEVDLAAVPAEVNRIVVILYLDDLGQRRRALAQLRDLRTRAMNLAGNVELVRSENLAAGLTVETGLVLSEVYRSGGGWKFKVIGGGYERGIVDICRDYGVPL